MTTASYITILRVTLILPIIFFSSKGDILSSIFGLFIYILAATTDYLDGYIARRTHTTTELGATLDLLADKIFVISMLVWLSLFTSNLFIVFSSLIICFRELLITLVRSFSSYETAKSLSVSSLGKFKTTIQMVSIGMIIISPFLGSIFTSLAISLLVIAAILSVYSMLDYLLKL